MNGFGRGSRGKILGHMSFGICFGQFGTEVIGWVRSGYHNKGVGELGLAELISIVPFYFLRRPCFGKGLRTKVCCSQLTSHPHLRMRGQLLSVM